MTGLDDNERRELQAVARRFLDSEASPARVRSLLDDAAGFDPTVWSKMADLGWLSMLVLGADGGSGAGCADVAVLLHELGRHVAPTPFLASLLGSAALAAGANDALKEEWLPAAAGGERILTAAIAGPSGSCDPAQLGVSWRAAGGLRLDGVARFVPDAHVAGGIVVCARGADGSLLFTVVDPKAAGVSVEVEATVDQTRRLASVALDDVRVGDAGLLAAPGELDDLHARLTSLGAWAVCADAAGTAERSLEMAVAYAKQRRQFGRPIGSFQAVKHHLANMLVAVEGSRAAVAHASAAFDNGGPGVHEAASVAKSFVGPACAQVCETAIQVHGGIGFTWEHDAHLYLKRAKLDEALFGSTSWHRRRLGRGLVAVQ